MIERSDEHLAGGELLDADSVCPAAGVESLTVGAKTGHTDVRVRNGRPPRVPADCIVQPQRGFSVKQ